MFLRIISIPLLQKSWSILFATYPSSLLKKVLTISSSCTLFSLGCFLPFFQKKNLFIPGMVGCTFLLVVFFLSSRRKIILYREWLVILQVQIQIYIYIYIRSFSKFIFYDFMLWLSFLSSKNILAFIVLIFCSLCLADFSVAVQVEALHYFLFFCSQSEQSLHFQLLDEFPSVLVPLSSDNQVLTYVSLIYVLCSFCWNPCCEGSDVVSKNGNLVISCLLFSILVTLSPYVISGFFRICFLSFQDVRLAAMECIERLYTLCSRVDFSSRKSGIVVLTEIFWLRF